MKLKLKKLQASSSPRRRQPSLRRKPSPRQSKTLTEAKEESHAGKGLGFTEAKKTFAEVKHTFDKAKGDHLDF